MGLFTMERAEAGPGTALCSVAPCTTTQHGPSLSLASHRAPLAIAASTTRARTGRRRALAAAAAVILLGSVLVGRCAASARARSDGLKVHLHLQWFGPFYSGGGYSSEAIGFAQALAHRVDRLKISQHGDTPNEEFARGMPRKVCAWYPLE